MAKFSATAVLVARDHVVIGWRLKDVIKPLSNLFGETDNVFDTVKNKFVRLEPDELLRLGVGSRMVLVQFADEAAAERRAMYNQVNAERQHEAIDQQVLQQVHCQASERAYIQTLQQACSRITSQQIHQLYNLAYNEAYNQYRSGGGHN